jgi:hypothetical protein
VPAAPAPRARPHFRESRPVRWWTVLIGAGVTLVFYVLVALVSWSAASFQLMTLAAVVAGAGASWGLVARGDPGAGIGASLVTGVVLAVLLGVVGWEMLGVDSLALG